MENEKYLSKAESKAKECAAKIYELLKIDNFGEYKQYILEMSLILILIFLLENKPKKSNFYENMINDLKIYYKHILDSLEKEEKAN